MKSQRTIGWLLIAGAAGVLVPYTILTLIFDYPGILREPTGIILEKFSQGGGRLIGAWFAFAIAGLPLIPAYSLLGQRLETRSSLVRIGTTVGLIGLIVQVVGLLRWVFVVPVLAQDYVQAGDQVARAAAVSSFRTIHQFAGVLLGEHIGQLFTITWTILISIVFLRLRIMQSWVAWLGITSALIYILAQAELFATVIPGFPVWDMAGFAGSTAWLAWLIIVGVKLTRLKPIQ